MHTNWTSAQQNQWLVAFGAAGAVEAIISVLSVVNDIVPPTINFTEGDEDQILIIILIFTFNKAQKRIVNAALSNTFGFGGHNASLIVKICSIRRDSNINT